MKFPKELDLKVSLGELGPRVSFKGLVLATEKGWFTQDTKVGKIWGNSCVGQFYASTLSISANLISMFRFSKTDKIFNYLA